MRRLLAIGIVAAALAVVLPSAAPTAGQPAAPKGATGMAQSNGVQLAWQPVTGAASYAVYRGSSAATVTTLVSPAGGVAVPSFTDTTAVNGSLYFYAVRAVASDGAESLNSQIVQATPVPRACSAGNAIVLENCYPGNNPWNVRNTATITAGGIEGYATAPSVNKGGSVGLKVNSADGSTFRVEIYRTGYYGGAGARLFSVISGVAGTAQPACTTDSSTGLIDCSNWSTSLTLTTTQDWPTGTYAIRIVREDTGTDNQILLVVRDDSRKAQIVYGVGFSDFQAYNNYGGRSLYDFNSNGSVTVAGTPRAVKVSYDRPFEQPRSGLRDWYTRTEVATVYWLEQQGYDVGYVSNTDIGTSPSLIQGVKAYISPAHDEYVSAPMRAAMTTARDAGTSLFFSGGNEIYWKIRFENGPNGGANRIQVAYKTTQSGAVDPSGDPTGTWRDPSGANQPENALSGIMYVGDNDNVYFPLVVSAVEGSDRIYRYTPLASQPAGTSTRIGSNLVGWEWDARVANGQEPAGLKTLGSSPVTGELIQNNGANYNPSGSTAVNIVKYTAASGALVFSTGTNHWNRGLAPNAAGVGEPDSRIQQVTTNVLADMGATPQTPSTGIQLDGGGVAGRPDAPTAVSAATAGPDSVSLTWNPVPGADGYNVYRGLSSRTDGQPLGSLANARSVTGTSFTDIGLSAATSYFYVVVAVQGGVQSLPSAESAATTAAGAGQPTRIDSGAPTSYTSSTGQVWLADTFFSGGNLRTVLTPIANTNDQKLYQTERWGLFNYAIPVANGTYDVRFHFGETYYGSTPALSPCTGKRMFNLDILDTPTTPDVQDFDICAAAGGPSTAVVVPIPNVTVSDGVLNIKSSKGTIDDPTLSAIEVIPRAISSPSVTTTAPGSEEADVSVGAFPRATFSRNMDAATINGSTLTLSSPSGPVAATVAYDPSTLTATLTPSSQLAFSTTYTATIASSVKAADGAPVGTDYTWHFTTQSPPPPDVSVTSPADGDSGASPATDVRATFTRAIDPATITSSSFTLRDSAGTLVPATVSYDSALRRATLVPSHALNLSSTYTARIGSSVKTTDSVALDAPFVWSFGVAAALPPPPTMTASTPASAAVAVPASAVATAAFSGPMDPATLTSSAFTLTSANGQVPSVVTYDAATNTATLTPAAPLAPSTAYTVTLTTDVRGIDGTPFGGTTWGFTTIDGPTVTSYAPVDGATYVDRAGSVTATFSRSMAPSSLTTSTFKLFAPDGTIVPAAVSYDDPSHTATLKPASGLIGGATYAASLSGSVRSVDGTPVGANDLVWKFTTTVCPCQLFPAVLAPASQNVPTRDGRAGTGPWTYELGVRFKVDEAMRLRGIRFFKSKSETGTHVANLWTSTGLLLASTTATGETASGWQEAVFSSPPLLQAGSVYVASVNANSYYNSTVNGLVNQVISGPLRSATGGPAGIYGASAGAFPTSSYNSSNYFADVDVVPDGDPAAPTVVSTAPSTNAADVDANLPLKASFSRPMDPSTITASTFNVRPVGISSGTDAGGAVDASVSYDDSTNSVTLTPSAPLTHGVAYKATMTTGIRAADGKALATGISWTFTVAAPPPPLSVTATPGNAATGVNVDATPTLVFNRTVDATTLTTANASIVAPDGTVVPATYSYDPFAFTATLKPSAKLAPSTTYTIRLSAGGVRAPDGTSLLNSYASTFTTGACPCTLMTGLIPKTVSNPVQDGRTGAGPWSYELGTKFILDQPASLASIRFWKDAKETGSHTVKLWSATGTLLASLAVTGETAGAGWQQANFATPIALAANTTYLASVNANAFFSTTRSGLAIPLTSGIAHSANDVKNGVYGAAAGLFPVSSFSSTNYFVDVVVR
jgi:fibronectin type 3 domain-containing protein